MQKDLSKLFLGVGVGAVLFSCAIAVYSYNRYSSRMAEYNNQYLQLQEDIEMFSNNIEHVSEDDVKMQVHSIKEIGMEISDYANRLQLLSSVGYIDSATYNESETRKEQVEIASKMSEYFGETSVLRTMWFAGDITKMEMSNPWSFMNSYEFSENTISVLWVCKDKSDNVVAYVTADYHADTNSFDNVRRHTTVFGMQYVLFTGDSGITITEDVVGDVTNIIGSAGLTDEQKQQQDSALMDEEWLNAMEENNAARDQLKREESGAD